MSEPIAGTNLTTVVEFNETALALSDLRGRYKGLVVDVQTPKGLKEAKTFTFELRTLRTTLEKKRKDLKAPIIERGKQLDDEAKRITAEIVALEEPIDVQIKAEEARIENARLAKLEAERVRVESLKAKIQTIRDTPSQMVGKPSNIINGALVRLYETALDEAEFAEYYQEASDARMAAMARVEQLLADQKAHEAEQARIKAEREELERMREENARLQREAELRAEADRLERERLAQVERDRVAAIRQELNNKIAAIGSPFFRRADVTKAQCIDLLEQARGLVLTEQEFGELLPVAEAARDSAVEQIHDAMQVLEQIEQERAERAEQDALLQAERDRQAAEQRKLDEQAAQLKRDQQAAKAEAERVRLAGLGLREAAQAVVDYFPNEPEDDKLAALVADLYTALANDAAQAKPARAKGAK